jgi:hypothetical protein
VKGKMLAWEGLFVNKSSWHLHLEMNGEALTSYYGDFEIAKFMGYWTGNWGSTF